MSGFINIWIKNEWLVKEAERVLIKREKYGQNRSLTDKRIMLEFGQPNTHKLPHIGHLFSYILGESLARTLLANGATIFRANYQGDIGLHVAKCLWSIRKTQNHPPAGEAGNANLKTLTQKVIFLQKAYQEGSRAYEEDEEAKQEILEINKSLYNKSDQKLVRLWQDTRSWSVEFYKEFEKQLGVSYDRYFFEPEVYEKGIEIVKKALGKVFVKSQGAIIFEGSKYGLHDRVFITKRGTPTYEAKDMALQEVKYEEWPFDLMVITTAKEQSEYFKVVFKALETLDEKFRGKFKHIGFGMVSLKSGKMSSRTGEIISASQLVKLVKIKARDLALEKGIEEKEGEFFISTKREHIFNQREREEVTERVALGAVKYSFLKSNPLQDKVFDIEESVALEGNSGPYLQYTHARAKSVLARANFQFSIINFQSIFNNQFSINDEERAILRYLYRFPEVVLQAGQEYAPNVICNFLYELAQRFNVFYNKHRILANGKKTISHKLLATSQFRLLLTAAVGQILQNGLTLLGIPTPEKM